MLNLLKFSKLSLIIGEVVSFSNEFHLSFPVRGGEEWDGNILSDVYEIALLEFNIYVVSLLYRFLLI